jgi:peptide/nickel transport system ATP-binding protein
VNDASADNFHGDRESSRRVTRSGGAQELRSDIAPLLDVRDLSVQFRSGSRSAGAVTRVTYRLYRGRSLAIVGESGSGKSVGCLALTGLLPKSAAVSGSIRFNGNELNGLAETELRRYRGAEIAIVLQDTENALNPTMRVGQQVSEAIRLHGRVGGREAWLRTLELFRLLRIPAPEANCIAYPHELSGGMRQRVMIAIALAGNPKLLIADEPTRALDATTSAQVLQLLIEMQRRLGMALILICHDLPLAARFADDILVMHAGNVVEYGRAAELVVRPRMRYTRALIEAAQRIDGRERRNIFEKHAEFCMASSDIDPPSSVRPMESSCPTSGRPIVRGDSASDPVDRGGAFGKRNSLYPQSDMATPPTRVGSTTLLEVVDIVQQFSGRGRRPRCALQAVSHVSFSIAAGETLGVVGETGSGKTTLARAILQIPRPTAGAVWFDGVDLTRVHGRRLREHRRAIQMVFQDPYSSVNPKWRVREIVEEPLIGFRLGGRRFRRSRVNEVLDLVGLPPKTFAERRPGELSGGQCQRVSIARAIISGPKLVVCDEAVSSLDVITREQTLGLFEDLRLRFGLSYLFISHDLAVVKRISHRIAVLYSGQLCEIGPTNLLFDRPHHPYTEALLAATTHISRTERMEVETLNESPSVYAPFDGCRFYTRCRMARERCLTEVPKIRPVEDGSFVACHFPVGGARPSG